METTTEYSCGNCGHKFACEEDWSGACDEHSCSYCECDCSDCASEEDEDSECGFEENEREERCCDCGMWSDFCKCDLCYDCDEKCSVCECEKPSGKKYKLNNDDEIIAKMFAAK